MLNTSDRSHMIVTPIRFHGHVIRKLSDWCSVVPDISIDAELPSLDVQLGSGDYSAILSLVNSLSDGQPTTLPSNKSEGEEDVRSESNEMLVPVSTKGTDPKDPVKLLLKFQMKEVWWRSLT